MCPVFIAVGVLLKPLIQLNVSCLFEIVLTSLLGMIISALPFAYIFGNIGCDFSPVDFTDKHFGGQSPPGC